MCQMNDGPQSDLTRINEVLNEYEGVQGSLITVLQKAQDIYGYLPKDVMYHIAQRLGVTPAEVVGVATFYSQFSLEPSGKYVISVCLGTACYVKGSQKVVVASMLSS